MLVELRAENYAVIDHAIASFGPGLNLLTGETGAGKSILIDALALLLGEKAYSEVVRHGGHVVGTVRLRRSTVPPEVNAAHRMAVRDEGGERDAHRPGQRLSDRGPGFCRSSPAWTT